MKNELTERNIHNIIFLKGIRLNAWQISKILSLKQPDVERVMKSKLYKKVPKKLNFKEFKNSMI